MVPGQHTTRASVVVDLVSLAMAPLGLVMHLASLEMDLAAQTANVAFPIQDPVSL